MRASRAVGGVMIGRVMIGAVMMLIVALVSVAQLQTSEVYAGQPTAQTKAGIERLSFLAGTWRGMYPGGEWESAYTTPQGGVVLSSSKDMRGGKVVMIEFEHFREVDGDVVLTPYPFGKKSSTSFKMTEFDEKSNRAVFTNSEHDFPSKLVYERTAKDELTIQVIGTQRGKQVEQTMKLKRVTEAK